jgi:predicted ATPase with chaperone activity
MKTITNISVSRSIEEMRVRRNLLEDLALKTIYMAGEISMYELARHMGLPLHMVDELFQRLRKEILCHTTVLAKGHIQLITTTSAGKTRALELLAQNQYVGPAPVSLDDYISRIQSQSVHNINIAPADVENAFEELVLEPRTLSQLGTAVMSGRAVFLHGPAGTGKTTIAETLSKLFNNDRIWLPYAVEVDGQIITV